MFGSFAYFPSFLFLEFLVSHILFLSLLPIKEIFFSFHCSYLLEFLDERNKIEVKNNVQLSFYFKHLKMPINWLTIDKSKLK